ncbi:MAG: RNA polymerase subunit sigma [Desulfobacca sp. 4484_104]|nr:MAG: RNA polymerase subunit sigma [Desulfobacca sp. 4484_104]RLA88960.1 MAG: FliA/WhiG family RNA polymerase sigma factor [Deltaproteobacteria bacterium]
MEKNLAVQVGQPPPQYNWPEKIDPEWQERMVLQYAPLIKYIASRMALRLPPHISMDDLISSGMMGLLDAIQKFDPRRNIDFKTYAEFRIKGAILDELRNLDWIPRSVRKKTSVIEKAYATLQKELGRPAEAEEVAAALQLSLEEFHRLLDETKAVSLIDIDVLWNSIPELPEDELYETLQDEKYRDPFISVYCAELREAIMNAIESLPDKEKLLISLYYYEELTMKEIGEIMGYTESRISQKHSQAIARLRGKLREYAENL